MGKVIFMVLLSLGLSSPAFFFESIENMEYFYESAIGFEKNYGQITDFQGAPVFDVLFSFRDRNYSIFIRKKGISYVIYKRNDGNTEYARVDLELLNSNIREKNIETKDEIFGYINYYLPSSPDGIRYVKRYRRIVIKDVYPGINWVFKIEKGKVHHEFEVEPFADIDDIRIRVIYADVEISENGKSVLFKTPLGNIKDGKIEVFEYKDGKRAESDVDIRYKLTKENLISYDVRNLEDNRKLIIDPPLSLLWSTYYGGSGNDYGYSATLDLNGHIILTGVTESSDFPVYDPGGSYFQGTSAGASDVFIIKFSNTGELLWATYYGGSGDEQGRFVSTDFNGNIFLIGRTNSADFPLYDPGGDAYFQDSLSGSYDGFIIKFSSSGQRLWATFYGGGNDEVFQSVTTDASGNVFITGYTWSTDFPTFDPGGGAYFDGSHDGWEDGFILKFSNTGILQWATYYGGWGGDHSHFIRADHLGNIFVIGNTWGNVPVYDPGGGAYVDSTNNGGYDIFILKFSNSGVMEWATMYGGSDNEGGHCVVSDDSGNIFITGVTRSYNFPLLDPGNGAYFDSTYNGGNWDGYIAKFTNSGIWKWSTYYGGSDEDNFSKIEVDDSGNVFITGRTLSTDFPLNNPGGGAYFDSTYNGNGDAYILSFSNKGFLEYSTYLGGNGEDWGTKPAIYGNDIVLTGFTTSVDFPLKNPGGNAYFDSTYNGNYDIFILKLEGKVLSIREKEFFENQVLFIPTFFSENLFMNLKELSDGKSNISLYSSDGRLVLKGKITDYYEFLSGIEKVSRGIYFLKIDSGNKKIKRVKLIKE